MKPKTTGAWMVKRVRRGRSVGGPAAVVSCAECAWHRAAAERIGMLSLRLVDTMEYIAANAEIGWFVKHESTMAVRAAAEYGVHPRKIDRKVRKQEPKGPYEPKATRPPSGRMPAIDRAIDTPYGPGKSRGGGR